MAKKPTKKPAAKRGGTKKPAPQGGKKRVRAAHARAAEREWGRKPDARAQNSALPHVDVVEQITKSAASAMANNARMTVEEQYRAEHKAEYREPIGPKRSLWQRFRSAITGRWVSLGFAKRHPRTTVGEKVER